MTVTHVPFEAGDSNASGCSCSSQADKQPRALWTGKERRSDLIQWRGDRNIQRESKDKRGRTSSHMLTKWKQVVFVTYFLNNTRRQIIGKVQLLWDTTSLKDSGLKPLRSAHLIIGSFSVSIFLTQFIVYQFPNHNITSHHTEHQSTEGYSSGNLFVHRCSTLHCEFALRVPFLNIRVEMNAFLLPDSLINQKIIDWLIDC